MPHAKSAPDRVGLLLRALVVVWLMLAGGALARAQQAAPSPVPASLVQVQLLDQSASQTRFRLIFAPRANGFGAVGGDSQKPALGFALTSRGNGAVTPQGLNGLVRQITFAQLDTVLVINFATSGPARAEGKVVDAATVDVVVSNGVETTVAAPAPLPVHQAAAPELAGSTFELVMLRYADVSEVVGLLTNGVTIKSNDGFTPREPGFGSSSITGGGGVMQAPVSPTGGGASDEQPLGQSVDDSLAVDRRLNAVWLKGSPERIARMKQEIALIDVPVDSVILETELVELTESGAKSIGIDFTNASGQIAVANVSMGGFIPLGYVPNGGNVLSGLQIQAAISAQIAKGNGKIVSRPRISALSGGSAKIITGDALPILTAITLSGVNGVSQQVQYVNVGVTLQIAPRVTADGYVTSHLFCVMSSVTGTSQGYPTISQREAETSATVHDGETFVVGGLTQDSTLTNNTKVPLLGDVPVLGTLFRNDKTTRSKTELYIVVTPHIVRLHGARAPLVDPVAPVGGDGFGK